MKKSLFVLLATLSFFGCQKAPQSDDLYSLALERNDDLRFSVYVTAHSVKQFLATDEGKAFAKSWSIFMDPTSFFTMGNEV